MCVHKAGSEIFRAYYIQVDRDKVNESFGNQEIHTICEYTETVLLSGHEQQWFTAYSE